MVRVENTARLVAGIGCLLILLPLFECYGQVVEFGLLLYVSLGSLAASVLIGTYCFVLIRASKKSGIICNSCGWKFLPGIGSRATVDLVVASKSCPSCGATILSPEKGPSNKKLQPNADASAE